MKFTPVCELLGCCRVQENNPAIVTVTDTHLHGCTDSVSYSYTETEIRDLLTQAVRAGFSLSGEGLNAEYFSSRVNVSTSVDNEIDGKVVELMSGSAPHLSAFALGFE